MLNAILNFLAILPSTVLVFYYVTKVVPVRRPKLLVRSLTALMYLVWIVNNYLLNNVSIALDVLSTLSCLVVILFSCPRENRLRGGLAYCSFMLIQYLVIIFLAAAIMPIIVGLGVPEEALTSTDSCWYALMSGLASLLYWPCLHFSSRLFISDKSGRPRWSAWLILNVAVPVSQVIMLNICIRLMYTTDIYRGQTTSLIWGIICCLVADLAMIIGIYKHRQSQRLADHFRMVQEQLDIQQSYYQQLQYNITQINHIRHDLNNQLQAAYQLLESCEPDYVRTQLDQLTQNLRNKVGPAYCANLMVDAVLKNKEILCREQGIRMEVSVELPNALPVETSCLCSIFSNLLDNSIHGVKESGAVDRYIELRAGIRAGCLNVHCVNPAVNPKKTVLRSPLRTHGLGLEILEHLAQQYSGSLQTRFENGRFEAIMILPLSGQ